MEQEYPFRPRGRHGFDREDVINYIAQAQQRCNEHLARMEELEAAKNAWYTQAKGMEREKASLVARNRELEEQLERGGPVPAGGEWFQADPMLASFQESQELAAVRARCLELEERLEQQNVLLSAQETEREQALADAREAAGALRQEADALRAELDAKADGLPRFTLHQQEVDDLRAQLAQQSRAQAAAAQAWEAQVSALAQDKAALEREKAALEQQLSALENEQTACAAQMPALREQLARLSESAEQITSLEAVKTALAAELDEARRQLEEAAQAAAAAQEALAALRLDKDALTQRCAALSQEEALARGKYETLAAEADSLRARIGEFEAAKTQAQPSDETLRSMVLASFNYSNLYVDNNLKTAQFISEATSRNIGRVSDSANSLLEQLDSIARSFNDTTDGIRRNLASFQRELGTIQSGMNRRLGKDRFAALLEENEKLRTRLETELLEELSCEEEERPAPLPGGEGAKLPFAEDLPKDYHEYLDD
ncbi:MAG: hypothetical protein LBB75_08295 [Oscillospiraceae bacterium]|jgi:predicted  nucleic acid-binding Zn-ribbon protein|nr:hypothetical protein [Oscillospiraceae bacterium]